MIKKNVFWILIAAVIAILTFLIFTELIFKSDSVNQGKFRVTDIVLTSTAELTNKSSQNEKWSIDLSQKNKLSILINIAQDAEIESIEFKDITTNTQNIVVYEEDKESKLELNGENDNLVLEAKADDKNQVLVEIVAMNENILKNWSIPDGTNEIVYDGRIFATANLKLKDIQFKLRGNLVITEKDGRENTLKINLVLPFEELLKNGADVRRLDTSDFKFKTN